MSGLPYFAYGSNLSHKDWSQFCREKGQQQCVDALQFRAVARLPDHELAFQYRSTRRNGGVLNVKPRRGQYVEGALYDVSEEGWQLLDQKEGLPGRYERFVTTVVDQDGKLITAVSYRVRSERVVPYVRPTKQYLDIVHQGLRRLGLSTSQLKSAAKNETPDLELDAFFFYGTLMRGERRFSHVQRFEPLCTLMASTPGRLLNLGACPALTIDESSDARVIGDFIRLKDPEAAIASVDFIEGFHGYDRRDSLYQRTIVSIDVGEGRLRPAWVYVFSQGGDNTSVILSGDWREHCGRKSAFLAKVVREHTGGDEARFARQLTEFYPFRMDDDSDEVVKELMPLQNALSRGLISERRLAQVSGNWIVAS